LVIKIKKEINQIKKYNPKNVFFHIFIDEIIIFWPSILKNLTNPTKKDILSQIFFIITHNLTHPNNNNKIIKK
jgi:hypothetical protein